MKNEKSISFQEHDDLLDFNRIKVETDKIVSALNLYFLNQRSN